jgi:signal transduction histidine kinase
MRDPRAEPAEEPPMSRSNAPVVMDPACAHVMTSSHPLETIPFFRRFRRSVLRDIVYTVIWNTLFALLFTLLSVVIDPGAPILLVLKSTFVFAQCIGFFIYAGFLIGDGVTRGRIHRGSLLSRTLYYSAIPIVGVIPGYMFALRILNWNAGADWFFSVRGIGSVIALSLVITGILLLIFIPRERAMRAEAAMAHEQARFAAAEKETATARMKLLEAQVEPHFLYNTLANVVSLIDAEPPTAKRMVERLIALLRATAAAATGSGTLGAQVEWLQAYLEIVEMRMGARLKWRIDVSPALAQLRVPPMLLQPVVENAIKHGLEPNVDGGEVAVSARRDGATLVLAVTDTGRGFRVTAPPGASGIGLANLRARLAALYGDAATLTVEDVSPHGARVTITLPVDAPSVEASVGVGNAPLLAAGR